MPASKEFVMALDLGSGSSRAIVFNSRGRVFAKAQFPIRTFYPKPGWAEHDVREIARTAERSLDAALARVPKSAKVLCLGIACQRSTVVLWDADTGAPLCRALSWQDGRAADSLGPLQSRQQEVHEKTGLYLTPYYSAPKVRWLVDHEPSVRKALEEGRLLAGPVSTYLLWKWTRGSVFRADPSMAQRMLLFNIRAQDWDADMLSMFNIPRAALPCLRPSSGDWATLPCRGRSIPVRAVLSDQQSAALGLAGEVPGAGVLNYGTGAFFLLHTGTEQYRVPGLLTSIAWQRQKQPCRYFLEGTVHAAGSSFLWLQESLGLLKRIDKVDAACRLSKHRLLALQAIGGLGAPRWDYSTFTTYMGMTAQTRPEDVVRAVADSIAYLISDIAATARGAGLSIGEVRASGGLSRADYLMQFQSDLLQSPILRVDESESTALGAASLAAQDLGVPWAGNLRAGRGRGFLPKMPAQRAAKLREGWKLFVETQQKLSSDLRRLGVLP